MFGYFVATTEDYMSLLHEAMPTNYALIHEACTVQIHIPSKFVTELRYCLIWCLMLINCWLSTIVISNGSHLTSFHVVFQVNLPYII